VTFKHENGAYKALAQTLTGGHLVNGNAKIELKWPKLKAGTYGGGEYKGGGSVVVAGPTGYGMYNAVGVPNTTLQGRFQPY